MRILADGIMFGLLGYCSICDWKRRMIPVGALIPFSIIAVFFFILYIEETGIGGLLMGVLFFVISKITKEAIGYGDSWIITILGTYLGGERLVWLLFIASILAGVFSLFVLWKQGWKKSGNLPFVPFLAIGYVGVMCL